MAKQDATWVEIDPTTLSPVQAQAYARYKEMYREMKAQRQHFEECMSLGVAQGQRMIFGYNFGKLSVAVVEDDRKATKPKQAKLSLDQFLAMQQNSGARC